MKKNFIAAAIATAASLLTFNALASDGTVNFNGSIIEDACTIDMGGKDALTVPMGNVWKNAFKGAGDTASATKFTIVATDCPTSVNKASVKFDGIAVDNDSGVLQLTGAGEADVAGNVGIQLADGNGQILKLAEASAQYDLQPTPAKNNLNFVARYISLADGVTAGAGNATATFTLNYE